MNFKMFRQIVVLGVVFAIALAIKVRMSFGHKDARLTNSQMQNSTNQVNKDDINNHSNGAYFRESSSKDAAASQKQIPRVTAAFVEREIPSPRQLNNPEEIAKYKNEYENAINKLPQEIRIINGKKMALMTSLFAISIENTKSSALQSNMPNSLLPFLPQALGPFVFMLDKSNGQGFSLRGSNEERRYPIVLVDSANKTFGVINGEISFYLRNFSDMEKLFSKYPMSLVNRSMGSQLNRISVLLGVGANLDKLLPQLEGDPLIDHEHPIEVGISVSFATAD